MAFVESSGANTQGATLEEVGTTPRAGSWHWANCTPLKNLAGTEVIREPETAEAAELVQRAHGGNTREAVTTQSGILGSGTMVPRHHDANDFRHQICRI
jgi:hypothetical protein